MRGVFLFTTSLASTVLGAVISRQNGWQSAGMTPHDSYSSSIGVLGCKINTNRVAYWPSGVDCDNVCVEVSYEDRSVYLLKIDQSGGAYDISYDSYNYLVTGKSATEQPSAGGYVNMNWRFVDSDKCKSLIYTEDGKLPLSAANSMNFVASCLSQPDSWMAKNYVLYNIIDPICTMGHDEVCELDLSVSNQPSCPAKLGLQTKLSDSPVWNIRYPTGEMWIAGSDSASVAVPAVTVGPPSSSAPPTVDSGGKGGIFRENPASMAMIFLTLLVNALKGQEMSPQSRSCELC